MKSLLSWKRPSLAEKDEMEGISPPHRAQKPHWSPSLKVSPLTVNIIAVISFFPFLSAFLLFYSLLLLFISLLFPSLNIFSSIQSHSDCTGFEDSCSYSTLQSKMLIIFFPWLSRPLPLLRYNLKLILSCFFWPFMQHQLIKHKSLSCSEKRPKYGHAYCMMFAVFVSNSGFIHTRT